MTFAIKINAKYHVDGTSKPAHLPAIITERGLLVSHLRYLYHNRFKSHSWREKSVQALLLLLEYMEANSTFFNSARDLFEGFMNAIIFGTIDEETLTDDSGLYWLSRSATNSQALVSHLNCYFDFLAEIDPIKVNTANPWTKANSSEVRINIAAYHHRKSNAFLGHLYSPDKASLNTVRWTKIKNSPLVLLDEAKRFPEEKFDELINKGFVRKIKSKMVPDFGSQAIVFLLHYGGIRKSEVFHIFLGDIALEKEKLEAVVRVFHPSFGESPNPERWKNRRDFLALHYNLIPRNEIPRNKRLHAGWKSPLLVSNKNFYLVNFFPPEKATEFLYIWRNYLLHQRVDPPAEFNHPYAFTDTSGRPLTIKNFQRIYAAALSRIGLSHKKSLGTTEHCHRHSYGYRLSEWGAGEALIQKALNHKSPDSCRVYISPTNSEVNDLFNSLEDL